MWVFVGFGGAPQFNWRVRATNLDGGGSDLTQSGQRWRFELLRGAIAQELGQPVTWTVRTHFHLNPDEHDPNGLICESVTSVEVADAGRRLAACRPGAVQALANSGADRR